MAITAVKMCELDLPTTHRGDTDTGNVCLISSFYLVKQICEKGEKGHKLLPPTHQTFLLG